MPNLIHSLDASSLTLLYNKFTKIYDKPQFLAIHDCFGTTLDKVKNFISFGLYGYIFRGSLLR